MRMKIALLAIETPLGRGAVDACVYCVCAGLTFRSNDRCTQIVAHNLCFVSITYGKLAGIAKSQRKLLKVGCFRNYGSKIKNN